MSDPILKRCCTCKLSKPFAEFYKANLKADGYQDECKDCYYTRRGLIRGSRGRLQEGDIKGFETEADKMYAAGFFDGEGHCHLRKNKAKNGKVYKVIHVSIGQSSSPVLEWFKLHFGGNIYEYKPEMNKKIFWQWSIVGTRAKVFLEQIKPYLKVKVVQVHTTLQDFGQYDKELEDARQR